MNSSPTLGGPFSHEGESVSDLLVIGGVNIFVDKEVSSD